MDRCAMVPETGDYRGRGEGHSTTTATLFPGFQQGYGSHKDEMEYKRVLTRLQRRAPAPLPLHLQLTDKRFSESTADAASPQSCPARFGSVAASAGPGPFGWCSSVGGGKDPIPLLTPLVSPTAGFQQQQQQGISMCFARHGD